VVLAVAAQAGDSVEIQKITVSSVSTTDISADATPTLGGNLVTGNYTVDGVNISQNIPSSLGTAGQVLSVNSGASATEWATPAAGAMEFIASSGAISNVANVSFTGFDSSKYDSYLFKCGNVVPATDETIFGVRMSVDSGSNYLSASDSYYTTGASPGFAAGNANLIPQMYFNFGNVAATEGGSIDVKINSPQINARTYAGGTGIYTNYAGAINTVAGGGGTKVATVVNAVQFLFNTGNIASGTITMYGIRNS
jgi:hypothetical protein